MLASRVSSAPITRWPLLQSLLSTALPFFIQIYIILLALADYHALVGRIVPLRGPAFAHAADLMAWEERLNLLIEPRVQAFIGQSRTLHTLMVWVYVHGYITCPLSALAWLFLARREAFALTRNVVLLSSACALGLYATFPLAPPRLTMALAPWHVQDWIHSGQTNANQLTSSAIDHLGFNPYAAMPSVHVLWAMLATFALVMGLHRWPVRLLAAIYPAAMILAVVAPGNHYVLDCVAAAALLGACWLVISLVHRAGRAALRASARCDQEPRGRWGPLPAAVQYMTRSPRVPSRFALPLWLSAVACVPLLLVDHRPLSVLAVGTLCGALALVAAGARPAEPSAGRRALLSDDLAGLLFVLGGAGLTDPPGHLAFMISNVLRLGACLMLALGRVHMAGWSASLVAARATRLVSRVRQQSWSTMSAALPSWLASRNS